MCNTTRSFAHESNACVRRWAVLILGFIDPLSCVPPPTTLLSTIFGWGAGSWHRPRTHVRLKSERWSDSVSALLSVCAQRRACATTPRPTLLFTIPRCICSARPAKRVRISSLNLCQIEASFLKSHHKVKNNSSSISK